MNSTVKNSYYAAANGFSGFRSYFDKIFDPHEFSKIIVLKGGPGTGKSTFMKKILSSIRDEKINKESIYCSSDPKSLDGIILESESARVAVLDGTAPHETDARIPGAIDYIINLGDAWNKESLISEKNNILELADKKSTHYKMAYSYLKLSGEIRRHISKMIFECYDKSSSISMAKDLLREFEDKNKGRSYVKLYSCFGKNGYQQMDIREKATEICRVFGIYGSESFLLNDIRKTANIFGIKATVHPSPFDDDITEGITFGEKSFYASGDLDFKDSVDTRSLISASRFSKIKNELNTCQIRYEEFLEMAKNEFMKASDMHFSLEEIYSRAMNFEKIDKMTEEVITDIKNTTH